MLKKLLMTTCLMCSVSIVKGAESPSAKDILDTCNVSGGLIVGIDCNRRLMAGLHVNSRCLVHGLEPEAQNVGETRKYIDSLGIYGPVSVIHWDHPYLPYRDNMVNLIVAENPGEINAEEVMRVLAPLGTAYVKRQGKWERTVKRWPKEIGEWTHWLQDAGNNPVARDSLVGPPNHIQWKCGPMWARSHDRCPPSTAAMVSAKGRLFYIYDEGIIGLPRHDRR